MPAAPAEGVVTEKPWPIVAEVNDAVPLEDGWVGFLADKSCRNL